MQNGNGTTNGTTNEPMKVDDPVVGAKLPDVDMASPASPAAPTAAVVEEKDELIVGLDFGAQKLVVAAHLKSAGKLPQIVNNNLSNHSTPSLVAYKEKHRYLGEEATGHATSDPANTASDLRSFLGRKFDEISAEERQRYPFKLVAGPHGGAAIEVRYTGEGAVDAIFTTEESTALLLKRLVGFAERFHKRSARSTVLTFPSHYGANQRAALLAAAKLAGLEVQQLVADVTAAALVYGYTRPGEFAAPAAKEGAPAAPAKHVLFLDMGASNFAAQIIRFEEGKLTVVAEAADAELGARALDSKLVQKLLEHFKASKGGVDLLKTASNPARVRARLQAAAEKAKQTLSTIPQADVDVPNISGDHDLHMKLTRASYAELIAPILERLIQHVEKLLVSAGLKAEELYGVEGIGGGLRYPDVNTALVKALGGREISRHLDGSSSVATGAALSGAIALKQADPYTIEAAPGLTVLVDAKDINTDAVYGEWLVKAKEREVKLEAVDKFNELLSQEKNALESSIYDLRDKARSNSTLPQAEKDRLLELFSAAENWMGDMDDSTATPEQYTNRLKQLKDDLRSSSNTFAKFLDELEAKRKQELLERLEAERAAAAAAPRSRTDKPKTNTEKIELASKAKHQGNLCFKEVDYIAAAAKYIEALGHFDQMWDVSAPQQKEIDETKLSCYLNLAACYLKLQKWDKAIHNATEALRIDAKNSKALFRRAQAYIQHKNWEAAKNDLIAAEKHDPTNAEVKSALAKVQSAIADALQREKNVYAKMFA